jgi:hypothetical protein
VSPGYATLETIRSGLGIALFRDSKRVPDAEVTNGMWMETPRVAE